ncbi:hypothetical protein ASPSYDRAFT_464629 [Aspergillus sydowii CBS 593.65]|uniref:Endonuclease/exonuclease/phosphatase domain-containing protein n=1 Tax=Aspergillus sydowii CBS 593.65 TaxID=1036612 RepID=A0A1L9T4V4_9EURO|nr:uncharacterized protein ASPSYDRAFT_464629 [Aspergillus sydowii CBS 593.65]OJJ54401.1 hypothetical protein ASPSYDRAFT_464629 [Aspergillus sydowii CBS 593.65]
MPRARKARGDTSSGGGAGTRTTNHCKSTNHRQQGDPRTLLSHPPSQISASSSSSASLASSASSPPTSPPATPVPEPLTLSVLQFNVGNSLDLALATLLRGQHILRHAVLAIQEPWVNPTTDSTHLPEEARRHFDLV